MGRRSLLQRLGFGCRANVQVHVVNLFHLLWTLIKVMISEAAGIRGRVWEEPGMVRG